MPSAKDPKAAPAKNKIRRKRKRAEAGDVTSNDKALTEKPAKKSKMDDVHSAAGAPAAVQTEAPRKRRKPRAKKTMTAEVTDINVDKASLTSETPTREKVKTVAFAEDAPKGDLGKRKAGKPPPEPPAMEGSGNDAAGPEPLDGVEEEEIHLTGFSSDSDSSDEDVDVAEAPPLDVSQLPAFAKDDAAVQRKLEKAKKHPSEDKGVLYLGRIPHGFYEDQMRTYFSQFGDVTRVRLSRNKKTGHSKHYAFIEFNSSAVAQIVSETMDNYLLMGHILKCKVIPKDEVHPELWVGANKKWRFVPRDRLARLKQNKPRSEEGLRRAESRLLARQKKKQAKILASGIDYGFDDVAYKQIPKD